MLHQETKWLEQLKQEGDFVFVLEAIHKNSGKHNGDIWRTTTKWKHTLTTPWNPIKEFQK